MIKIRNLKKKYTNDIVLEKADLTLSENGIYLIKGKSGCGKTTLLNIIGLIDEDFEGEYYLNGKRVDSIKEKALFRKNYFTYLHQFPYFIENETVINNLLLIDSNLSRIKIHRALEELNLSNYENRIVSSLSGGEKRRLSFCSILLKDTPIILCDEVTAALDKQNKIKVMEILKKLSENHIIIFVTHEKEIISSYATKIINVADKKVEYTEQEEKVRKLTFKKRTTYLSPKYITSHILRLYKTKKVRMMMSIFTIVISLVALGLSLSIKSIVNTSVKGTLKDQYKENQILCKRKNNGYYIDELLSPSYSELIQIKRSFSEVKAVVPFYYYNFENNFYSFNNMSYKTDNEKVDFEGISVRNVSEFILYDELKSDYKPLLKQNLLDDEVIISLPLKKVYELCKTLKLKEDEEVLHKRLEREALEVHLIVKNESWDYKIDIPLKMKDFVISNQYHLIHTNQNWNEYILEKKMQLVTTNDFYKKEFIPWEMKKGYALKVEKDKSDGFLESFMESKKCNGFNIHLLKKDVLLSLEENDISGYDNFFLSKNNEDRLTYNEIVNLSQNELVDSFLPCSSTSYYVYEDALLQGFNKTCIIAKTEELIEDFVIENEYLESDLGPFQSNIMYSSEQYLFGDAISSSKKNSFHTRAFSSSLKLLNGTYISSSNEVIVSSGLLKYLNVDFSKNTKLPIAFLKEIEYKEEKKYQNKFYQGVLDVVGVVDSSEKNIYISSGFTSQYFIKNILPSFEKIKIDYSLINVKEGVNAKEAIEQLNMTYDDLVFYSPLMNLYDEVDRIVGYINLFLIVFSTISLISSLIMIMTVSYLFYEENKGEIPTYIVRGYSKNAIVLYFFSFSLLVAIYSFFISSISLVCISVFTSSQEQNQILSSLTLDSEVFFIMFCVSVLVSLIASFGSLQKLLRSSTLTLLNK